jgi:hypothetical protein
MNVLGATRTFIARKNGLMCGLGNLSDAMPKKVEAAAPAAPSRHTTGADLETFLARAGAKERAKIEKHLLLRETETGPGFGKLWRRVASVLGGLAPLPVVAVSAL